MIYIKNLKIISVCFLILNSCAVTSTRDIKESEVVQTPAPYEHVEAVAQDEPVDNNQFNNEELSEIIDEERILNEQLEKRVTAIDPDTEIPLPTNKYVNKWINYFTGRGRAGMRRFLERSGRYVGSMKKVLLKKGLPEDLVYLPVIESGFATKALSNKGAMGYWQFMPSTARGYGLKVNSLVDERRDYVRSTEAAAIYLKKLYTVFGDWYLALAAYNAGENRVKSQLMKAETRNYWELIDTKGLYKETRDYVPKYIAATLIFKNPESYGFKNIEYHTEQSYQKLFVKKPIDLKKLAKVANIPYQELKDLNPRYKTNRVPIYRGKSVLVRVPRGSLALAQASVIKSRTVISKNVYKPLKTVTYKVRRGDNLTKIARRFKVSVSDLKRKNGLGRRSVLYVGRRLKIFTPNKKSTARVAKVSQKTKSKYRKIKKTHKVRRGESLSLIARRHGMSLKKIAKINGFSVRKKLKVGQRIKLVSGARAMASTKKKGAVRTHKVKYGENLNSLARKYKTTVTAIKRQNNLRSSKLKAGQHLKVKYGNTKYHVVKPGESLIAIAKKYRVSLGKLLSVNNFKNKSKINIGSRVKIPFVSMN